MPIFYDIFHQCIVNRSLIAHLSLYARLMPLWDKKRSIMGLVCIINQQQSTAEQEVLGENPGGFLIFIYFFSFLILTKKRIEILMKIHVKITIIVGENTEPYPARVIWQIRRETA